MENANDQLVVEKIQHNGESKTYVNEKKMWMPLGKISWAAIFSGVLVTIISQMLFSLLGMGIGLSTVDPLQEQDPMRGLGTGTIIWWSVTMLISLFFGGLTTGRMYQTRSKAYLAWHGLLTWCTFTLISFFMLTTSVGMLISGAGNVIGTAVRTSASVVKNTPLDISSITRNANSLLGQTGMNTLNGNANTQGNNNQPGNNGGIKAGNNSSLVDEVQNFFQEKNVQNPESRQALINALSSQTGMDETEASNRVDRWINSYNELKAEAKVKADQAARAISIASIVGFFALLVGALVTIWGARVALQKDYAMANKAERNALAR
jgi:hypothetical protein